MARLRHSLRDMAREARWLLAGGAPSFIADSNPHIDAEEIPVFLYHSIQPNTFEKHLRFLKDNGYRSLTADEFHACVSGRRRTPKRSVLLTIDDGRSSIWRFAAPQLRKYQMQAVCFIIPGLIADSQMPAGPDPELMTWPQILQLHDDRIVDFQSHTLYHHRVFSSPRLTGFIGSAGNGPLYDLVIPQGFEMKALNGGWEDLWGLPVYESHSLMSGKPRFLDDPDLRSYCNRHVRVNGGSAFFRRKSWSRLLAKVAEDWRSSHVESGRMQTAAELRAEILENLKISRNLIEQRLAGKRVRHLAFPYGEGSRMAVEQARRAGYISSFWTSENGRYLSRTGANPYSHPRLSGDYVLRLPGHGRRSLAEIVYAKLVRRLRAIPVH